MEAKELEEIIETHQNWAENPKNGIKADLSGESLVGAKLKNLNLSYADFEGSDLAWSNLRGTKLQKADLRRADLSSADLSYANLKGADLKFADFRRSDLTGADLTGAILTGADFRYCKLDGVKIDRDTVVCHQVEKYFIDNIS